MNFIEGFPVPANEANLPLDITRDAEGKIKRIDIVWRGTSIREQFPWTLTKADCELG